MITATLTNGSGSLELPLIEVPLSEQILDGVTDVETLDKNIYTDFIVQKRQWQFPYDSLSEDDYNAIRAFYSDQFVSFNYPTLSIPHYSVSDVPVRMYLNTKEVYNNCGDIQNIQLSFRETNQLIEVS